jgi:hypothetical protein
MPTQLSARCPLRQPLWPDLLAACDAVPDVKDRHVLAAAIGARADVIVTDNLKHFPDHALAPSASRRGRLTRSG